MKKSAEQSTVPQALMQTDEQLRKDQKRLHAVLRVSPRNPHASRDFEVVSGELARRDAHKLSRFYREVYLGGRDGRVRGRG